MIRALTTIILHLMQKNSEKQLTLHDLLGRLRITEQGGTDSYPKVLKDSGAFPVTMNTMDRNMTIQQNAIPQGSTNRFGRLCRLASVAAAQAQSIDWLIAHLPSLPLEPGYNRESDCRQSGRMTM